jgi:ATP-binding cassette subfamily B protein
VKARHAVAITQVQQDAVEKHVELKPLAFFKLLRRVFSYTAPHAKTRNWLILTVVLRSMQLPALAWAIGAVINGPITNHNARGVVLGAIGFCALAVFTQVTFLARIRLALELGEAVIHDIRNEMFAHLQQMTAAFYDKTKVGRIISRMSSDLEATRFGVQDLAFITAVQLGQMLISAAMMLWYDWVLFLLVVAIAPILWAINRHFHTRLGQQQRQMQESFSRLTATLAESVSGVRVTQGFVRQEVNAGLFRELVRDHSRYISGAARTTAVFLPLLELNSQFFIALLLLVGGYRVLNPQVATPIGSIVQFFFLANLFFDPIRVIGTRYTEALSALVGAERVFRLLDTKPAWSDPPDATDLQTLTGRVEFRDVSFGYDPQRLVLNNVSFVAEPGRTIALVGHTGGGKTSITNLITKSYLPTRGELLIDGRDIMKIRSQSLRQHVGVVHQQNFLFEMSVLDNIRFSRPQATEAEVVEVVRKLDFLDLIEALPDGFRTAVGEGGSGLSLGQRQLICFSRALLADPRILILDEATSSIDAVTEERIQKALATLLRDRTSFVVAHRLSTIRKADLILVLQQGKIVERGTHRELLQLGGIYKALYAEFIRTGAGEETGAITSTGAPR